MMPVISLTSKYLKPAKYDNLLTIRTSIKEKPQFRCKFEYEILNESKELLHVGETTLVFIDTKTNRPVNNPKQIADKFDNYFNK
jgi:acyl-CoA thioester hydrolase